MNDTIHQERAYEARHIAELLEIGDSTLRKWCLALEKQGYSFVRDNKGNRLFTDHDIISLRTLKTFTHGRKMTIENGASAVVLQFGDVNLASTVPALLHEEERSNERYDELKDGLFELKDYIMKQTNVIRQQNEMIQNLVQRLDLQEKTMLDREQLLLEEVKQTKEPSEERQARITELITIERVKSQLRKEALNQWSAKPESERTKRTGVFGLKKEEDYGKRDLFISDYVDEHLTERLKQEYEI